VSGPACLEARRADVPPRQCPNRAVFQTCAMPPRNALRSDKRREIADAKVISPA